MVALSFTKILRRRVKVKISPLPPKKMYLASSPYKIDIQISVFKKSFTNTNFAVMLLL